MVMFAMLKKFGWIGAHQVCGGCCLLWRHFGAISAAANKRETAPDQNVDHYYEPLPRKPARRTEADAAALADYFTADAGHRASR
jgi:hypothetical protein